MALFLGILFLVCLFVYGLTLLSEPTNKRVVEITYESGKVEYQCEEKVLFGWREIESMVFEGNGIRIKKAIFPTKEEALKYIGKHLDQIIKSEKEVEI